MLENAPLLRLVKDELDLTLQHAETRLRAYAEGANDALAACMEDFNQVAGTFRLVNVPAAELFAKELHSFTAWLEKLPEVDSKRTSAISSLTIGITKLERYLNYLSVTEQHSAELLMPAINEIRLARGTQAYPDSLYFAFDVGGKREILRSFVTKSAVKLPDIKDLRRLRHMYQVGLLEVIRDNEGGFRLMKRALERVEAICGDTAVGEIWPLAQIAIEAMVTGDVALTRSRKLLFAWLDKELKQLSLDGNAYLASEPSAKLVKELCYIIAISAPRSEKVKAAQLKLSFSASVCSDASVRKERELMAGPDNSVIQAVAVAVNEELSKLKDSIDLHCCTDSEDHSAEILLLLESVAKTLHILELDDLCREIKELVESLSQGAGADQDDKASAYGPVIQLVLKVERVMTQMLKGGRLSDAHTGVAETETAPASVAQEVRKLAISESRAGLALAKQSLTSFMDSGWDKPHLGNVPDRLHGVWGALYFLDFSRAAAIMLQIQRYIEQRLLASSSLSPTESELEALADAVTGVDYYLESIEQGKPLGVGILEVAEESLEMLGFPVDRK